MAASLESMLLRIEGLEKTHKQQIEHLEKAHQQQIQQLVERLDTKDGEVETLLKLVLELSNKVSTQPTVKGENVETNEESNSSMDDLTRTVRSLESQFTPLFKAAFQAIEDGIPKHKRAFGPQATEDMEFRRQLADARRQVVKDTCKILEANDDLASQITELRRLMDAQGAMVDGMGRDVRYVKKRVHDCIVEDGDIRTLVSRAEHEVKQVRAASARRDRQMQALSDRASTLPSNSAESPPLPSRVAYATASTTIVRRPLPAWSTPSSYSEYAQHSSRYYSSYYGGRGAEPEPYHEHELPEYQR